MNISIKREQNNARISSAEREKFGAKLNSKILSPLRRDGYKAGMIMMLIALSTMLLTTACSSEDDLVNNTANTENTINKGYALPVTVNVTRGGDATTRATYNESTKKLEFSDGDKLFVYGSATAAGSFAGTLTWQSGGTFSGTIYTQNPYPGTADALFTAANSISATLLPNGYDEGSNSFLSIDNKNTTEAYDDRLTVDFSDAFVASETAKATGVEQLSLEQASTYSSSFTLSPGNAILNFTISGLAAGAQDVTLQIDNGTVYTVTGSVTPTSGVATFAIGVPVGANISSEENNLTVGSSNFTLPSSTTFAAGKIYNITRAAAIPGVLNGQFSVSSTKKVYFSKGNLRYASGTWSFFDNQYDYYTSYSADAWDKFGWSTSATTYGMNTSTSSGTYSGDFVDWGATMGTGWFTLTSDEWTYLFNNRSASTVGGTDNGRYAKAKVNNVQGIILFPDTYTHPDGVTAPTGVNATGNTGWNGNNYSSADWTKMESAGCVFLPAAGLRNGTSVSNVGSLGFYWSSTANDTGYAYNVFFNSGNVDPASYGDRSNGFSVRLVRDVAAAAPKLLSDATAEDIGKVVCAAGHLHPAKTAVPSGCTAVGILGKVTATGHGLILALKDATSQKWNTINGWTSVDTYAGTTLKQLPDNTARGTNLTSYTTLGSTAVSNWCVAQKSDYEAIFINLGSTTYDNGTTYDANVNAYITTDVGGTDISGVYWSATEYEDNNYYGCIFISDRWDLGTKGTLRSLRPVLGF